MLESHDHYETCRRTDRDIFLNHWGLIMIHVLGSLKSSDEDKAAHLKVNERIYYNWISWSQSVNMLGKQHWDTDAPASKPEEKKPKKGK